MSKADAPLQRVIEQTPGEPQYHQALEDVMDTVLPYADEHPDYKRQNLIERLLVPDRSIQFRVTWMDDEGEVQINNGWRGQHNNAIGPYKGGLRFHPAVNLDTFKFLAFEQTFKNALTGLPMGGGKGGADFNPKGKSDAEIMRFCQAFMTELHHYIGPDQDIPAGDIGVGSTEIGYLFGTYKKITQLHQGALTGKNPAFGGSCVRTEATGHGCVYFLQAVLEHQGVQLEDQRCALSGAGNVALHTAEKLLQCGARVISFSDSGGCLINADGFSQKQLQQIQQTKTRHGGSLGDLKLEGTEYREDAKPWEAEYDIAIPAATQNEIEEVDARHIIDSGARFLCEAANMPTTQQAMSQLREKNLCVIPAKAANAGGVAVSGLERAQNAQRLSWSYKKVDQCLQEIMGDIHRICVDYGGGGDQVDYIKGANLGAFVRVADATLAHGCY
ncbi:MAG: NADP-specific glutamate dehydrogenase [Pseudomonadales bacterium]|nr:NADP-specific glutamate dehydrogenase [Pseudomonadales bacterium]